MDAVDLDVLATCGTWLQRAHRVALVTVMRTWGSAPRPPGSMMALRDDGQIAGSVSGGCIEDDLVARVRGEGLDAIACQRIPKIVRYGVSADDAHRMGIPCGGTLQLAVEHLAAHSMVSELLQRLKARRLTRRTLDLRTGAVVLCDAHVNDELYFDDSRLVCVLGPRFRLLVIGAGQLSRYLCQMAIGLGFEVTVCDPRDEFSHAWDVADVAVLSGMPDDVLHAIHPDARTAVIALTHDPKLDDLALMDALRTPAFYVGALGSRINNLRRRERLADHFGLSQAELARLRGPAGIYIGSRNASEIALSIMAEIVAAKNGVAQRIDRDVGAVKEALAAYPNARSRADTVPATPT